MDLWIKENKKELLKNYETYILNCLEFFDYELEYLFNFEKFCKYEYYFKKQNYKEVLKNE